MLTTIVKKSSCPTCGKVFDSATCATGNEAPKPGDVTVCFGCGMILVFTEDMGVRPMTPSERADFRLSPAWPEMVKAQRALDKMLSTKHGAPPKEKKYFS
jgi:hypothetical protein